MELDGDFPDFREGELSVFQFEAGLVSCGRGLPGGKVKQSSGDQVFGDDLPRGLGMEATEEDHVLMTLVIKSKGKLVDLEHIREKISRDVGRKFSEGETAEILGSLIERGFVREESRMYAITEAGREYFEDRWRKIREHLNQEYLKVYRAKRYYPNIAEALLEICKDRWVSVFRLFTGRAWLQRKLGSRYITIRSREDVERWLDIHGIDFIPYVHRINSDRPDWFVLDFDAGREVSMEKVKEVVRATYRFLEKFGVEPKLKYSGSRGFQLWARFELHPLPKKYRPMELRTGKRERNHFNFYADLVRFVESQVARDFPGLTTSDTAHKEARRGKILFDASIMKPMGDVRAPYSMHFKTGQISMPLNIGELRGFKPEHADPEKVVERYSRRGNEFVLPPVDGSDFFEEAVDWFDSIRKDVP